MVQLPWQNSLSMSRMWALIRPIVCMSIVYLLSKFYLKTTHNFIPQSEVWSLIEKTDAGLLFVNKKLLIFFLHNHLSVVITCLVVCRNWVICCRFIPKMNTTLAHLTGSCCFLGFRMHLLMFLGYVLSIMACSLFLSFLQWEFIDLTNLPCVCKRCHP